MPREHSDPPADETLDQASSEGADPSVVEDGAGPVADVVGDVVAGAESPQAVGSLSAGRSESAQGGAGSVLGDRRSGAGAGPGAAGEMAAALADGAKSALAAADGDVAAALAEARRQVEHGELWRARDVLLAVAEQEPDPQVLKELGEVQHRMGDLPAAGAAWFATTVRGLAVDEAIAAWRSRYADDFVALWSSLPAAVRATPSSPKVAALRAKAVESGLEDDARVGSADTGWLASEDGGRVFSQDDGRAGMAAGSDRPRRATAATRGDRSGTPGTRSGGSAARSGGSAARSAGVPSTRPTGVPSTRPAGVPPSRSMGSTRPAANPADQPALPARSRQDEPVAEGEGGFDAARFIAWVLAAAFVVCAVVGLVTILRWIVPGG